MGTYVIFDVDIPDPKWYQDFIIQMKPALEEAAVRYLARGGGQGIQRRPSNMTV